MSYRTTCRFFDKVEQRVYVQGEPYNGEDEERINHLKELGLIIGEGYETKVIKPRGRKPNANRNSSNAIHDSNK